MQTMEICHVPSYSDDQLLELIKSDKRSAFNELYKRHWSRLYIQAFNICGEEEACKDICQEVFIWFWENRQSINIKSSVQGYLSSAVKYKVLNFIRHGKVRADFFEKLKKAPEDYLMEDSMELKELQLVIKQFSDNLPERCGEIFKLSRNEYYSNREIAVMLNISERTVENQISIALKKLRRSLDKLTCWFFL